MSYFKEIFEVPDGLLNCGVEDVYSILGCPTLIHLEGHKRPPLFVTVLLHGNERTGFLVIQSLLKAYKDVELPRSLSIFIGNVRATQMNARKLDDQPDYNRVWAGDPSVQGQMASEIKEIMKKTGVFASVDIHNNTGRNPDYTCVASLQREHLRLATLFGKTVVYVQRPNTTQTAVFSSFCPSVTLECGLSGSAPGIKRAYALLDACLHLNEFPKHEISPGDIDLYESVARMRIPDGASFSFVDAPEHFKTDFAFRTDFDKFNFQEIPQGTIIGQLNNGTDHKIALDDQHGCSINRRFLEYVSGRIQTTESLIPSMFTTDHKVIEQDCLGYLMVRRSNLGLGN